MIKNVICVIDKKAKERKRIRESALRYIKERKEARIIDKKTFIVNGVYRECFD